MKNSTPKEVSARATSWESAKNLCNSYSAHKAHTIIKISDTCYYICTFKVARTYIAQGFQEFSGFEK